MPTRASGSAFAGQAAVALAGVAGAPGGRGVPGPCVWTGAGGDDPWAAAVGVRAKHLHGLGVLVLLSALVGDLRAAGHPSRAEFVQGAGAGHAARPGSVGVHDVQLVREERAIAVVERAVLVSIAGERDPPPLRRERGILRARSKLVWLRAVGPHQPHIA